MSRFRVFVAILLAVFAAPAVAHADPVTATAAAFLTSAGMSAATATAVATFTVNTLVTAATSATRAKWFGRRSEP